MSPRLLADVSDIEFSLARGFLVAGVLALLGAGGWHAYSSHRLEALRLSEGRRLIPSAMTPEMVAVPVGTFHMGSPPSAMTPEMVAVPAGTFHMGSRDTEQGPAKNEGPIREIRVREAFAVGRFEVTFDEWDACAADGGCQHQPSDQGWGRGRRPVINVSWDDAKGYVSWLSRKTGKAYRLLSEAEWEYTARAGTTTRYSFGEHFDNRLANTDKGRTVEVGQYPANSWNLHDMHGNVWEWVEDCYSHRYPDAPGDDRAQTTGCTDSGRRVVRGGSWSDIPQSLRSANRNGFPTTARENILGFRLARSIDPTSEPDASVGLFRPLVAGRDVPATVPTNGKPNPQASPTGERGPDHTSTVIAATLHIAPHSRRGRDGLTGIHQMRLKAVEDTGRTWWVGCVPCFNALTAIAIGDKYAVALNGSTETWASRYSIEAKGKRLKVLEWSKAPQPKPELLGQAFLVEGCQPGGTTGSLNRSFEAVAHGTCMR